MGTRQAGELQACLCCALCSCSVVSDSLRFPWTVACQAPLSMGILQARKNTGVGCHALLQGIFPTQGSNPGLPHCRILYCVSTREVPGHVQGVLTRRILARGEMGLGASGIILRQMVKGLKY